MKLFTNYIFNFKTSMLLISSWTAARSLHLSRQITNSAPAMLQNTADILEAK